MSNQLTTLNQQQPQKVSLIAAMASKYHMEPAAFQATIKATVMPSNATNEQMAAFLLVAHEYDLNPITKEIYAFPAKGGGVTPMVGVDGWINLAQRRPEFDGMEHEFEHDEKGECVSCTCKIYRKDRSRPIVVTEFMVECRRGTDPWRSHPRRMLRHRATVQAIRYAFGFAGIKDEDDSEVIYANAMVIDQPKVKRLSSVSDIARHEAEEQNEPEAQQAADLPEWPQANADGELVDVRGCPWIADAHSASKSCNDDGTWRKRRGVDKAEIDRLEAQAMQPSDVDQDADNEEPAKDQEEPESDNAGNFAKIQRGILAAPDRDTVDEWLDYAREVVVTQGQRYALEAAADERKKQIAAA